MEEQYYTIILRHDTSTKWLVNDPVLYLGEYGVEDDTHKVKRGDGESKWSELPYEDFGLQYIVTFENLHGKLSDNETLVNEFDKKIDKNIFDDVSSSVVTSIIVVDENIDEGNLMDITRTTKNILSGASTRDTLVIKSSDKTVQAFWSINDEGQRVLNLRSASSICDYEPERKYYKDQLCYKGNKLYRAYTDIVAEPTFNPDQWVLLASLHSNDIKYDNLVSGLDSENVKDALDELKRRDDRKVQKSTEERIVYGTDLYGQQTVIPIDDLRKVDTVNHKQADLNKNVQIDAGDINYSDANPSFGTVRQILDAKVDKTFAGQGAKIVRDVQFNYNEVTGHIELVEDKVSPEDGSTGVERVEIDVVSEQELAGEVQTLNNRIDTEVQTLNDRIDTEVDTLNNTITTKETAIYNKIQAEHDEINTRVDNEVDTLNSRVDTEVNTLNERIDNEVETLNTTITTKETEIYSKIQDEHDEINARVDTEVQDLNDRIDDEVETLNNTITTKEQALQAQITHNADEIERVETESKDRDETLDDRITSEVATLNDRIDDEVQDLNGRIDTEVQTLNTTINTKDAAMDAKKIDKDISETIVTFLEVATHDSQPTVKITNKNTTTKTPNYDYIHFGTQGAIKTRMEDADHIIIDSTDIDTLNTQQNARLTNAENRLTAHDSQIATLLEHDVNHDRHLATIDSQIAVHEQRLDTDEVNIAQLQNDLQTEAGVRENTDNALSQRITTNAINITTKADKEFADYTNDKVVGKLESASLVNNELFKLKETLVSPVDGSSSTEYIKIISSDNTVIATRQQDGTIDLATNLDTDVNYFVTTEIISTTIAAETTLDMTKLTPTDKQEVELQDIISDPEGTWGRVKSIDTQNDTCVVVTFKKHAQAVWGTIKGTLADQQDLQAELNGLDSAKVDKTNSADKVYGTDNNGEQTLYDKNDFGKVDTVNNVQPDNNKNVTIGTSDIESEDISGTTDTLENVIIELQTLVGNLKSDLQTQVQTYTQNTSYTSAGNYVTQKFVTFTRDDGIMLMAKVLNDFISDNSHNTPYECFMYDVEIENLKLVGIPEQSGDDTPPADWELYTTVTMSNYGQSSDGQEALVNVYRNNNNDYIVGFDIINNSNVDTLYVNGDVWSGAIMPESSSSIIAYNSAQDYTYYDTDTAISDVFNDMFFVLSPDWEIYTSVTIDSVTSSDNRHPVVFVYKDNHNVCNVGFKISNNSLTDELDVSNLISYSLAPDTNSGIYGFNLANNYTYYDNENAILEELGFQFRQLPKWELVNTFTLNNPTSTDNETPFVSVYEDINHTTINTMFNIENKSNTEYLRMEFAPNPMVNWDIYYDNGYGFQTDDVLPNNVDLNYIENNFTFRYITEQEISFDILGDVMPVSGETYDGPGGTDEEIEEILDEVLGE